SPLRHQRHGRGARPSQDQRPAHEARPDRRRFRTAGRLGHMVRAGRGSIKRKLILASMVSNTVALLIVGAAITTFDLVEPRGTLVRRLSVQTDIVGANCLSALLFSDAKSAETTLAALKADPRVRAAGLYASDGRLFA